MKDTIAQLVQLQKVDSKIFELENAKGDLPDTVRRLKEDLEAMKTWIESTTHEIQEAQKERRQREGELKLTEEKLKKHQNQLYDVTTNKEYDAITQEIEQEKENISYYESRILELIALEEETTKELEDRKTESEQIQTDLQEKEKELRAMEKESEDEELKLMHEREKILVRLNKRVLSQYKRILHAKNHLAVVPITRNACGGCFNTIPPQKIVEIRKMSQIYSCEVCGRILVWQDNGTTE